LNVIIHVGVLVSFSTLAVGKPVSYVLYGLGNVASSDIIGSRVIGRSLASLVYEGEVDEMEVRLPGSSMVLNIVGKGRALNKGIHILSVD